MNFFDWFGLPAMFRIPEDLLRSRYLEHSRRYHPDHHAGKPADEQEAALRQATFNTLAYETLRDEDKRLHYLLQLTGMLGEEDRQTVPSDFLMDMLELNEAVQNLEGAAADERQQVRRQLAERLAALQEAVRQDLETFRADAADPQQLERLRDYYLKRRYLLRLRHRLDSFEPTLP